MTIKAAMAQQEVDSTLMMKYLIVEYDLVGA
jgi:hypothetical protein